MNERAKVTASHLARHAVVYLRQSSEQKGLRIKVIGRQPDLFDAIS